MQQTIKINTGDYNLSFNSLLKKRIVESNNKTAFIYKGKEYSWNDIEIGSTIISKDLANLGVKKGTHVGICGVNSINWIFTFFAISKLGAIAVLINPGLRPQEVLDICKIGGVTVLCYSEIDKVTTFDMYKNICLDNIQILSMYNFSDYIDFKSRYNECLSTIETYNDPLQSDDACLIIYTSGSTGKPKAVLASAYSIMYSIKPIIENINYSIDDVNLAFLPFFHIFGFVSSIVISLIKGYCSIIPSSRSVSELITVIDEYKVTIFNTVPTMMLAIINSKDFEPLKLASLRSTILGGSTTTKEQMIMLKKLLPNNHFGNIYGMSENASISVTDYDDSIEHITETVGKPLDGNIVVIKDNNGKKLCDGNQGEICVKSGGMLVWYYKLPLNMQPIDSEGFLRTGDLGYIDKDGYIRLTGRIKDLIISGGENISPNEVAEAIQSLNHFIDVKVVGIPDSIKGEVVAAALIIKPDYIFNEKELTKELSNILARYKLPVYYKVFNSFPLLGTGKIDKVSIVNQMVKEYRI